MIETKTLYVMWRSSLLLPVVYLSRDFVDGEPLVIQGPAHGLSYTNEGGSGLLSKGMTTGSQYIEDS